MSSLSASAKKCLRTSNVYEMFNAGNTAQSYYSIKIFVFLRGAKRNIMHEVATESVHRCHVIATQARCIVGALRQPQLRGAALGCQGEVVSRQTHWG